MDSRKAQTLDKKVFYISATLVLVIVAVMFIFPKDCTEIASVMHTKTLEYFGFAYTWMGIAVVAACCYFAFSKYGKIKFGSLDEKPEFSNFSWAATLFTSGIASALIYWSAIEWSYYYSAPALGITPFSPEAAEWAGAYSLFHWTIVPWALYVICALPIGYSYFIRKKPVLKVSEICRDLFGDRVDGWLGKIIDIFFIVSIIMGTTTDIGFGIPVISAAISALFHSEVTLIENYIVLGVITILYSVTAYLGLKKGIAKLGSINTVLGMVVLAIVLFFGPTSFIIKMSTDSAGLFASNFVRMLTWTDPVNNGGFPETWTQFYWAWWLSYGPFMGLFIARISRGRTVKNVLVGSILFGSLGCAVFFMILGNFQMNLQLQGIIDFVASVQTGNPASAIMEGFNHLPNPINLIVMILYAVIGTLFAATTFNSVSSSIAAVSMKNINPGEDPKRIIVLAWAILLVLLPAGVLGLGGDLLGTLQSVTIVGSVPTVFIMILEVVAFVKMVKHDGYFEQHCIKVKIDASPIIKETSTQIDQ